MLEFLFCGCNIKIILELCFWEFIMVQANLDTVPTKLSTTDKVRTYLLTYLLTYIHTFIHTYIHTYSTYMHTAYTASMYKVGGTST